MADQLMPEKINYKLRATKWANRGFFSINFFILLKI